MKQLISRFALLAAIVGILSSTLVMGCGSGGDTGGDAAGGNAAGNAAGNEAPSP